MWEKTQLQTESLRSSVRLYQVGIEHRHKVQLEELCCEFRQKIESLRSFVELFQVGIEQVHRGTEGDRTAGSSRRRHSARRA